MKVIEHIERAANPLFSYEIIPPLRGKSVQDIINIVEVLKPLDPPWIDVTSHSAGVIYEETNGIIQKKIVRKRPGTIGICGVIQNRFKIDTVAHLLCQGFTQAETEDALIELNFLGVENVLAIKGDNLNYNKQLLEPANKYAGELVAQIKGLGGNCIGVAGYPEKHFEAPNIDLDLKYLKQKVDAGADYIVTQMFFDNTKFHAFKKRCRDIGIMVPIIPGLKIIDKVSQLTKIPGIFHTELPTQLTDEIYANPKHIKEIGAEWARVQVMDLLEHGNNVHFYIMNNAEAVSNLVRKFK